MALLKIATHPEAVGKAKVGDDHVAALVQEQILELEISVNDPFLQGRVLVGRWCDSSAATHLVDVPYTT